jgi:hypothetical protein
MKFTEGIINRDFATNSGELFAKTQQKCKHGKTNLFIHMALGGV